jgi:hypothetical protein
MNSQGSIATSRNEGKWSEIKDSGSGAIQYICISMADIKPGQDAIIPGVNSPVNIGKGINRGVGVMICRINPPALIYAIKKRKISCQEI